MFFTSLWFWIAIITITTLQYISFYTSTVLANFLYWPLLVIASLIIFFKVVNSFSFSKKIFGQLNWTGPDWVKGERENKKSVGVVLASLAGLGLVTWGIIYFVNKDPDLQVKATFNAPSKTYFYVQNDEIKKSVYDLSISFDESVAPLKLIGKEVKKHVSIFPQTKGKWIWDSGKTLRFQIEGDWKIGKDYKVVLDEELISGKYQLSESKFTFQTQKFEVEYRKGEFYEDPRNPNIRKVIFEFYANYPTSLETLKSKFSLKQVNFAKGGSKEVVNLEHELILDKDKQKFYIHAKGIKIPKEEGEVTITLNSGIKSIYGGNELTESIVKTVRIPGLYDYFHIDSAKVNIVKNEKNIPEHILAVSFSTGVASRELKGAISAWQLPKYRVQNGRKIRIRWDDEQYRLNDEELKKYKKIKLDATEAALSYPKVHFFKGQFEADTFIFVKVKKGIKSGSGIEFVEDYTATSKIPKFEKEIKIMGEGGILSLRGEKKLSIYTMNVKGLKIKISQVLENQVQHILSQTYNDQHTPKFNNNYNFNESNITHLHEEVRTIRRREYKTPHYETIDLGKYINKSAQGKATKGLFFVQVSSGNNYGSVKDKRLILVTDLGIILKKDNSDERRVYVQSLSTGEPIKGLTVEAIKKNGLSGYKKVTNSKGEAIFPKFNYKDGILGFLVRDGRDLAYIKKSNYDRMLNYSRFDVGGVYSNSGANSVTGYLFSDRGIYRPGEDVRIGHIVKAETFNLVLDGMPLKYVVTNSAGKVFSSDIISLEEVGFGNLIFKLPTNAPTGNWSVNLYRFKNNDTTKYTSLIGSVTIKVQEFEPDNLKIKVKLSKKKFKGWIKPNELLGHVHLENLYGIAAAKHDVKARLNLTRASLSFNEYKGYRFYAGETQAEGHVEELGLKKTDNEGDVNFELPLEKFERPFYRLSFFAQGFEKESGRFVVGADSTLVGTYNQLVGIKKVDSLDSINKGDKKQVDIIAIDSDLRKSSLKGLKLELIEKKYVNVLTQRANGTFGYESTLKKEVVRKKDFTISEKGNLYALDTSKAGNFVLKIKNSKDEVLNEVSYYVMGDRNLARSLSRNAELEVKLVNKDVEPGGTLKFELKAPYTGSALVTIERDQIYTSKWIKVTKKTSMHSIRVPASVQGNGYLNIMLTRGQSSNEIYMSPFSYGVFPFSVNQAQRVDNIEIETPDVIKPGQDLIVKHRSESADRVVLFAVDEGILQFAKYKTPDPLKFFLKKKSLQVSTWQILDLIIAEFSKIRASLAMGGGMLGVKGSRLNPFARKLRAPVAFWSGIIDASTKWKEWKVKVPEHFNGRLRVMAVSVGPESIGVGESATFVRGDLILSAKLPYFLSLKDSFKLPISVMNNIEGLKDSANIKVSVDSGKLLTLDKAEHSLFSKAQEEKSFTVNASVKQYGSDFLSVNASDGDKKSRLKESLSVRPTTPYSSEYNAGFFKDNKTIKPSYKLLDFKQNRKLIVSSSPKVLVNTFYDYLSKNIYGCTEQIISQSFSHLVLKDSKKYFAKDINFQDVFKQSVSLLRSRQNYDGWYSEYGRDKSRHEFINIYAAFYLVEAKRLGMNVPKELMDKNRRWLKNEFSNLSSLNHKLWAAYLLTRMEMVTSSFLNEIKEMLKSDKSELANLNNLLAASIYKLLQSDKLAYRYLDKVKFFTPFKAESKYMNQLVHHSMQMFLVSQHFADKVKSFTDKHLESYFGAVNGDLNTLSANFSLNAINSYASTVESRAADKWQALEWKNGKSSKLSFNSDDYAIFNKDFEKLELVNNSGFPLFYAYIRGGYPTGIKQIKSKNIQISKTIENEVGNEVTSVKQGDTVVVTVRYRHQSKDTDSLALVDLVPGGFELVMEEHNDSYVKLADYREDRLIFYLNGSKDDYVLKYKMKATFEGKFLVPAAYIEDMYKLDDKAVTNESFIEIKKL